MSDTETTPRPQDLVRELQRVVHGGSYAVSASPKEVWEGLLEEVRALKTRPESEPTQMWVNAMSCVRPTDEFAADVGRSVIRKVMASEERDDLGVARVVHLRVVAS